MADFSLQIDVKDFLRATTEVERKQLPFAAAQALNATAQDVLEHVQNRMEVVFDRPTRFTKNAFMVWRANKRTLEAKVQERPSVGSKHYLKVQETGGARPATGMEKMLRSALAYNGVLSALVPAEGAKLDRYGNWSSGERNQALSAINGWREAGYKANSTDASRKRAKGRAAYFVGGTKNGSPGIYKRTGTGKREKVTKVAHFVDGAPSYRKRLGFLDGAQEVFAARFEKNFAAAFQRALATAR